MVPESPASPPENGARNDSAPSMSDRDELAARDALSSGLNARSVVGKGMERFSALVNDNIVAARYGVFATVALLTAYGISNTPLFFRYRNVAEIPKSFFIGRRRLYCRVVGVHRDLNPYHATGGLEDSSIQITVRHLSPIGMLLPTSWFESLMRISPSRGSLTRDLTKGSGKAEVSKNETLRLQIAGVLAPPVFRESYDPAQVLERLAKDRTLVSCQLLGREVLKPIKERNKSVFSESNQQSSSSVSESNGAISFDDTFAPNNEVPSVLDYHQVALCRISYRPQILQVFPTDLAEALVKAGSASVASDLLFRSSPSTLQNSKKEIVDTSHRIQDIRQDLKYLDRLAVSEFESAQKSSGMWSVQEVREIKKDITDEVHFQANASLIRKIWRRIRGE